MKNVKYATETAINKLTLKNLGSITMQVKLKS